MKLKKKLAVMISTFLQKEASKSANCASGQGFHQPKEPEAIRKLRK